MAKKCHFLPTLKLDFLHSTWVHIVVLYDDLMNSDTLEVSFQCFHCKIGALFMRPVPKGGASGSTVLSSSFSFQQILVNYVEQAIYRC